MTIEPGMVIDLGMFGDIAGTDLDLYRKRGVLKQLSTTKDAPENMKQNTKSTKTVRRADGTVVVERIVEDDKHEEHTSLPARIHKQDGGVVVEAPQSTMQDFAGGEYNPQATKGDTYQHLPDKVKEAIAKAEKAISADQTEAKNQKSEGAKVEKVEKAPKKTKKRRGRPPGSKKTSAKARTSRKSTSSKKSGVKKSVKTVK